MPKTVTPVTASAVAGVLAIRDAESRLAAGWCERVVVLHQDTDLPLNGYDPYCTRAYAWADTVGTTAGEVMTCGHGAAGAGREGFAGAPPPARWSSGASGGGAAVAAQGVNVKSASNRRVSRYGAQAGWHDRLLLRSDRVLRDFAERLQEHLGVHSYVRLPCHRHQTHAELDC